MATACSSPAGNERNSRNGRAELQHCPYLRTENCVPNLSILPLIDSLLSKFHDSLSLAMHMQLLVDALNIGADGTEADA